MALVTRIGGVYAVLSMGTVVDPNTALSYTGTKSIINDGGGNWRVKFLTSGTLTVSQNVIIDIFLVGGGGGGGQAAVNGGGGGAGYTSTHTNITLSKDVSYSVVIGSSGAKRGNGGSTSISVLGYSANGGYGSTTSAGGNGGSGGGGDGGENNSSTGTSGGSNGGDGGIGHSGAAGTGQGTTTREFAETTGDLYAGGGAGAWDIAQSYGGAGGGGNGSKGSDGSGGTDGSTNTGGGGGFNHSGGSGIVIIRNTR